MSHGKLFIISAPSGTGKTTVVYEVLRKLQPLYDIRRVITYTSRAIREGEIHGIDYIFISTEEFKEKVEAGFFMEWSAWYGDYYGSPRSVLTDLAQGISWISILDQVGAKAVKLMYPEAVLIWMAPPSMDELERRLRMRGTDSEETIKKRLAKAAIEIEEEKRKKTYNFFIINDDFDEAVKKIINCILGQIAKK